VPVVEELRKSGSDGEALLLQVEVPDEAYHRKLISCQEACPVHTDARGYVRAIAEGRFEEAYLIARGPNPFASICGRICGAPCEVACRRGKIPRLGPDGEYLGDDRPIAIRALKRFVCEQYGVEAQSPADVWQSIQDYVPAVSAHVEELASLLRGAVSGRIRRATGQSIAIIGGGPAGLSAAHDLALLGFNVIVYESEPVPAGMLTLGVPSYRLPRDLIRREVALIEALGVEIRCGVRVGSDVSFASLRREHAAVLIAVGAKRPRALGLPGERGPQVYGGVDLLRAVALGETLPLGRRLVVIGGGNVAYDVARTVVRQIAYDTARTAARLPGTAEVHLVSLETLEEMPADTTEIREGDEEGIRRRNGWGPVEIVRRPDGTVEGVRFRRCLRVYDENRRFAPEFDESEQFLLPCDTVLFAAGQAPDLTFLKPGGEDIEELRPGWPKVDPRTLATSAPGVFVAGDLAHGTRLVIDAVASGKRAARSIYAHVTGLTIEPAVLEAFLALPGYRRETGYEKIRRVEIPTLEPEERLRDPHLSVELPFDQETARREASRCLDCGVTPVFDGTRCVLCTGCVDVCPTACLKIVPLRSLAPEAGLDFLIDETLGPGTDRALNSAILKDEDRCIRCALCAQRCPVEAILMERVTFQCEWRSTR
jgi:NADPH-dependent glutamate synthase beta subunit-like oxidoreductase